MSNNDAILEKIQKEMQADDFFEEKKKKVQEKRLLVDDYKLTNELTRIKQAEEDVEKASNIKVGMLSYETIEKVQEKARYFLE
jgi:hypothetical protein